MPIQGPVALKINAVQHRLKAKNALIKSMRKDSLINTNAYLKDSKRRKALLVNIIVSSTKIEGVHLDWDELEKSLSISNKDIRFYVSAKSCKSRR
jgi:multidrug resistance efflux pump